MLELERELVERVNQLRKTGGRCSDALGEKAKETTHQAVPPLVASPRLACAARLNSEDMARTGHFAHRNLAHLGPEARSRQAGYSGKAVLENLAWGQVTASAVTAAWLGSREHCQALFSPESNEVGVGVTVGPRDKRFWTLLLGTK